MKFLMIHFRYNLAILSHNKYTRNLFRNVIYPVYIGHIKQTFIL